MTDDSSCQNSKSHIRSKHSMIVNPKVRWRCLEVICKEKLVELNFPDKKVLFLSIYFNKVLRLNKCLQL